MARILALVAAVGLVAGAVVLRGALGQDDDGDGDTPAGVIWCDPLLAEACNAAAEGAEVELIEPGEAFTRLSDPGAESAAPPPSTWVTVGDWPAILATATSSANGEVATFGDPTPLASTPLVLAGNAANLERLTAECAEVTWGCLADVAGTGADELGGDPRLGEFRLGHVVPPSSTGLFTLDALVATIPDGGAPSRTDVESQAFAGLLDRIDSGEFTGDTARAADQFLARPGEASVFVGPEALLDPKLGARDATLLPVAPTATLTAQLAPLTDVDGVGDLAERLGAELTAAGWEPPTDDGADAGLLAALLDTWGTR
ncbi:MAG: hypothetical protein KDB24_00225 [Microthrixaceae bacterium]|nr:hypothetical protein [Microthrixaceae bacterium]